MQPEQCSVASSAASIYHSKQNRSHISDAASQLHPPEPLGYNSWQTPKVTEARDSLSALCVRRPGWPWQPGQRREALTQRWIPRERRDGWSALDDGVGVGGSISFNSPARTVKDPLVVGLAQTELPMSICYALTQQSHAYPHSPPPFSEAPIIVIETRACLSLQLP